MIRRFICFLIIISYLIIVDGCGRSNEPINVSLSKLYSDPSVYNHKLIKISGVISYGYEQFVLTDPNCPKRCGVWLEYGGLVDSGTIYCCGVSPERKRTKPLVVENISIPLIQDETFRKFDELLPKQSETTIKATVIGRFFAGERSETPNGIVWQRYGHMGCCSLLVIQQVVSVDQ